jgi:hypothetical protein
METVMQLDERSVKRLDGVHPDLVRVVTRAAELSEVDSSSRKACAR